MTREDIATYISRIDTVENTYKSQQLAKQRLEQQLKSLQDANVSLADKLDICSNAVGLLTTLSDNTVKKSCEFITDSLNAALSRIFTNSRKRVKITESIRGGSNPQLEMELYENDDATPLSLKDDSGHGVSQIISFLCTLCLIAITGKRRLFAMDEITSGLSSKAREIISDIMNEFTNIGFQFIVSEHGFIPRGSKVIVLESNGNTSSVKEEYVEENGVFLSDGLNTKSGLSSKAVAPAQVGSVVSI